MSELLDFLQTPVGNGFIFLFGLLWGSFFNVCIVRMPSDEEVVKKPSHCRSCKHPLKWYHNIPLFSYLALRGKCGFCKVTISPRYPLVELLTAALFLLLWRVYGPSWQWVSYTVFCSSLLIITFIDLVHYIIPDEISIGGIFVGFAFCFLTGDIQWWESLLGIALGGGSFFLIAYGYERFSGQEGLGGGDVKLLGMIGAWLGYRSLLTVVVASSTLGSVVGLTLMAVQRKSFKTAIPFGPFLAAGAVIHLFYGNQILDWLFPTFP